MMESPPLHTFNKFFSAVCVIKAETLDYLPQVINPKVSSNPACGNPKAAVYIVVDLHCKYIVKPEYNKINTES